ncbi:hypothetical protein NA57DRAFT_80901 [Rhizodiscina lignyota]|uniref:NACHT domain-containing protein n=1 Tax=Rhizodiscina lignyota TaxID=1504668 RepID=A0A9P4M1S3_9PEZI|nr:hypothetical protein NA57DRAFT_80901 [Rhizodiscina lignyota]
MAFGVGFRDIVTALKIIKELGEAFVNSPKEYTAISNALKDLSAVLDNIKNVVASSKRGLPSQQESQLQKIATECRTTLQDLQVKLSRHESLASSSAPQENLADRIRNASRRTYHRFTWSSRDISEWRDRITLNVTILNAFMNQLTQCKPTPQSSDGQQRNSRKDAIIEWLCQTNHASFHRNIIRNKKTGTGEWFLNPKEPSQSKYLEWVKESKQILFCEGIPGAGKTMISVMVIDDLENQFQADTDVNIAYIYCGYQCLQQEHTPDDFISNILGQLLQRQSSLPEGIEKLYEKHRHHRTRPGIDEIGGAVQSTLQLYMRSFIILDALDEYHALSNGDLRTFLTQILALGSATSVNILATSRPIEDIRSQFDGACLVQEIRAHKDDLLHYVHERILELLRGRFKDLPDLEMDIVTCVSDAAAGMFLLPKLQMDYLALKPTVAHIRRAPKNMPKGDTALDETYSRAWTTIESHPDEDTREIAKQLLCWITHARRELSVVELQHAVAVQQARAFDPEISEFDEEFLPPEALFGSICAGLVTVDPESDTIRLVHYTLREYFHRTNKFQHAQVDIATTCIIYLSFDTFSEPTETNGRASERPLTHAILRLQCHPFYDYAAENWGYHVQGSHLEQEDLLIDFLSNDAKLQSSLRPALSHGYFPISIYDRSADSITPAHVAAYFGLSETLKNLFSNGYDPDTRTFDGQSPLAWVAFNGQAETVQALLEPSIGINPNSQDDECRTPLSLAASRSHENVVKVF